MSCIFFFFYLDTLFKESRQGWDNSVSLMVQCLFCYQNIPKQIQLCQAAHQKVDYFQNSEVMLLHLKLWSNFELRPCTNDFRWIHVKANVQNDPSDLSSSTMKNGHNGAGILELIMCSDSFVLKIILCSKWVDTFHCISIIWIREPHAKRTKQNKKLSHL